MSSAARVQKSVDNLELYNEWAKVSKALPNFASRINRIVILAGIVEVRDSRKIT